MNPYANEEIMWQRLKDRQREAENSRLFVQHAVPRLERLLERLWMLAGLAVRPEPGSSAAGPVEEGCECASEVA